MVSFHTFDAILQHLIILICHFIIEPFNRNAITLTICPRLKNVIYIILCSIRRREMGHVVGNLLQELQNNLHLAYIRRLTLNL